MRVYYKIVGTDLKSILACYPHTIQYKVDEWVSSSKNFSEKGYDLLIFTTLRDARLFGPTSLIFRCHAKGVRHKNLAYCFGSANWVIRIGAIATRIWPKGTVMAKQVKLLTEVPK